MNYFIIFSFLFLLTSCGESGKRITIIFNGDASIKPGLFVTIRSHKIGKVTEVKLNKKLELCAVVYVEEKYEIPKDSRFLLTSIPPFQRMIEVTPGHASKSLKNGSWVHGEIDENDPMNLLYKGFKALNKLDEAIDDAVEESMEEAYYDSIDTTKTYKTHAK